MTIWYSRQVSDCREKTTPANLLLDHTARIRAQIELLVGTGQGTTGRIRAEGWVLSWKMVFVAVTHAAEFAASSPVLRLRSNRGKLLLESSSRRRWPARKTLLVAPRSIERRYACPRTRGAEVAWES